MMMIVGRKIIFLPTSFKIEITPNESYILDFTIPVNMLSLPSTITA
jgi:hypothetical protein